MLLFAPCVFNPLLAFFVHAKCFRSLLHTLHMCLVFLIFLMCFPHTSSAFNPLCIHMVLLIFFACSFHALCVLDPLWMFSSCAWCYWSSSHALYTYLVVFSILSTHAWSSISYFSTLVHSILSTCSFVSCLSTFYPLSHFYAPSHEFFFISTWSFLCLFLSFHVWSSFRSWSFELSLHNLILSMPSPPFPSQCVVLFPWLTSNFFINFIYLFIYYYYYTQLLQLVLWFQTSLLHLVFFYHVSILLATFTPFSILASCFS